MTCCDCSCDDQPCVCVCVCCRQPADEVVAGLTTKADKIRALFRAGYSRSEIAGHLDIRYQHVRNVLVQSGFMETQLSRPMPAQAGEPGGSLPELVRTAIGPGGRVVIPAAYQQGPGGQRGRLHRDADGRGRVCGLLMTRRSLSAPAKCWRKYVPEGVSLVDELIADRRREAAAEEAV